MHRIQRNRCISGGGPDALPAVRIQWCAGENVDAGSTAIHASTSRSPAIALPIRAGSDSLRRALAELLVIDGNSSRDTSLIADPERNMKLNPKVGVVYKDDLKG